MGFDLALVLLALSGATRAAEPLWGGPEFLDGGRFTVVPGLRAWPVNGYGGNVVPEIHAGAGLGGGFDLRTGLGVDVPVYYRENGGLYWGYAPPSLHDVDLVARWTWRRTLGVAVRGQRDDHDRWRVGPEVVWAHEGRVRVTVRPGWAFDGPATEGTFGIISVPVAVAAGFGERWEVFGEVEPSLWPQTIQMMEGSDEWLGFDNWLDLGAGAWWRPVAGGVGRLGVEVAYRVEDHTFLAPWEGLSFGLRYGLDFGAARPAR